MGASNVNVVVITGNLTRDPELRHTGGGTAICEMRVAVNSRRKVGEEWVDKVGYFDVLVWGAQGENCANYLSKGRPVAVDGRLDWREWEAKDGSGKRQAVQIVAEKVQFLGSREGAGEQPAAGQYGPVPEIDVLASSDDELMKLTRDELDALADSEGVENPEEYKAKADVVDAMREAIAERPGGEDDIPF